MTEKYGTAEPKIVIIGAGMSGLASAAKLSSNGFKDLTILEGRDRVGGRISTVNADGHNFEMGAFWMYGKESNPCYELSKKEGMETTDWDYCDKIAKADWYPDPVHFDNVKKDGPSLNQENLKILRSGYLKYLEIFKNVRKTNESAEEEGGGGGLHDKDHLTFMKQHWAKYITTEKANQNSPDLSDLLHSSLRIYMLEECYDIGGALSSCPALPYISPLPGKDVTFKCGYSRILNPLIKQLPEDCINLNCEVTKIKWIDDNETNGCQNQSKPVCVTYKDKNGSLQRIEADHVIVTLPLGCLKLYNFFKPRLPEVKRSAITNIGFGFIESIRLTYEKPFWNSGTEKILLLWKADESLLTDDWRKDIVSFDVHEDQSKELYCLETWLVGDSVEVIKFNDSKFLGNAYTDILRRFFGTENIPEPKKVITSGWHEDRFSRGSYSYPTLDGHPLDREVLADPLPSNGSQHPMQILFAGEATHPHYFGTVHGAFETGQREANRIIKHYKSEPDIM